MSSTDDSTDDYTDDSTDEPEFTDDEKRQKLFEVIDRLKETSDFCAKEVEDDITFLYYIYGQESSKEDKAINLCGIEHGLVKVSLKIMKYFFKRDFLNDKPIWVRFERMVIVFWNGSCHQLKFCERLLKDNAQQFLLEIIQQPNMVDTDEVQGEIYARQVDTLEGILGVIHNMLGQLGEKGRTAFRELNAVGILQQKLKHKNITVKAKAFINLAYLINEEENELINADDKNIRFIVNLLRGAIYPETRRSRTSFSSIEAVKALNKLAVNDKNKLRIHNSGALQYYEKLLTDGATEQEQATIIRGIWMLCFHPTVRDAVKKKPSLMSTINEFQASNNEKVQRFANGVFWALEEQHAQKVLDKKAVESHIMISYNWDVQPLVLKIRDQLVAAGFKVWIDVKDMSGSTLEAMADAVENAAVVVVCMTRKYKESPSCRTEAEYAYQQRKTVIPLVLEKGYKADGWLGIMTGTRLWFDVVSNFHLAMDGLLIELKRQVKSDTGDCLDGSVLGQGKPIEVSKVTSPSYASWSAAEVSEWLKKIGLGQAISKLLNNDGGQLQEFIEMRREMRPEFFYNLLRDDFHFSGPDILKFTKGLKQLDK